MSNASFDILTKVSDILLHSVDDGAFKTLLALCNSSPDLFCYLYHKIHREIELFDAERCSRLSGLVAKGLVQPYKVEKLRLTLFNDSPEIRKALQLFFDSPLLTSMELHGLKDGTNCSEVLVSMAVRIASTSKKPITVILIDTSPVPYAFIYHTQHIELQNSFALESPSPAGGRISPLRSITCSTDAGQSLFSGLFLLQVELPYLTHLSFKFKPTAFGPEPVEDTLTAVLDYSDRLEQITIAYEPGIGSAALYLPCVERLGQVLLHVASRHRRLLSLNFYLDCNVTEAFDLLINLGAVEGFENVSISVLGTETSARLLMKYAYHRFIAGGANKRLRLDHIVIDKARKTIQIRGFTIRDSLTSAILPRARSHHTVCPWVSLLGPADYVKQYQDCLIPVNML